MAIGDIWRDQHRSDQAIVEYLAAVTLDRKNCELRLRLAQARLASFDPKEWVAAGQDFTTTIGLAEFVPACRRAARLGRAEAACKEGRFRFALEEFNELVAEKQDDVLALIGRGKVEAELHRYERAVPDLNEAVALAPKDAHCLVVRADIKTKQFNFRGALHDLDEAVKLDPKSSEAYFVRGKMLAKQKKWAPAIAAFSEAIALDANNAPAYLARSEAYQAKGQTDLAKTDREQVERLSPSSAGTSHRQGTDGAAAPQNDGRVQQHRRPKRLTVANRPAPIRRLSTRPLNEWAIASAVSCPAVATAGWGAAKTGRESRGYWRQREQQ